MRSSIALSIATLALLAGLAVAGPEITVTYRSGVPVIQLAGSFAGSSYTVYRATSGEPEYRAISDAEILCIGECSVADYEALPGRTYFYRFDLAMPGGRHESFGPYAVTIPREQPLTARVSPNPGRGPATISVTLSGRPGDPPVDVEAALFDVQGRALRTLHRGPLARGTTTLEWNGRDGEGRTLGPGLYFLRLRSAAGGFTARVIRTR
jgi:hypothetical protein